MGRHPGNPQRALSTAPGTETHMACVAPGVIRHERFQLRAVRTESEMSAVGEQRARGHLNVRESTGLHQTQCWTLGFETALPQMGFLALIYKLSLNM